jgi:hypothetical protein
MSDRTKQHKMVAYFTEGPLAKTGGTFHGKPARLRMLVDRWKGKYTAAIIYAPGEGNSRTMLEKYDRTGLMVEQRSTL